LRLLAARRLGAEALRLIAEKLSGAKSLLGISYSTTTGFRALAVRDGSHFWVYIANAGSSSRSVRITTGAWGVGTGREVVVERVAAGLYGEVTSVTVTSTNGVVPTLVSARPACCCALLRCPACGAACLPVVPVVPLA
jgi:hypothetical protein